MPIAEPAAAPPPRPRSPAQIEAARQNGARSRGPVSPEGKARAARNALKHGLAAIKHLVLDDEDQAELDALTESLMAEIGPTSEVEARLVQRLAAAFWKGERAERLEAALFAAAPTMRPPCAAAPGSRPIPWPRSTSPGSTPSAPTRRSRAASCPAASASCASSAASP